MKLLIVFILTLFCINAFSMEEIDLKGAIKKMVDNELTVTLLYNPDLHNEKPLLKQLNFVSKAMEKEKVTFYKCNTMLYPQYYARVPIMLVTYKGHVLFSANDPAPSAHGLVTLFRMLNLKAKEMLKRKAY